VIVQLPVGEITDSYRLYLYVRIINDIGTITLFNIATPVVVSIDDTYAASLTTQLTSSAEGSSAIMRSLQNSEPTSAILQVLAISSIVSSTADPVI
jgi:hypothetical protein